MPSFHKYLLLREEKEVEGRVSARVTLGSDNDFEPFFVSDDPASAQYGKNRNLAPIIKAFKKGGRWGWTRDESGEEKPVKISGKKLYLSGGTVRDHLSHKKVYDYDLVTNASSDEIEHILTQNGFAKEEGHEEHKLNFWPCEFSADGKPFSFKVNCYGTTINLSCLRKTPYGIGVPPLPGSLSDDAKSRDFTINAMYILLTNDNGANKELIDFFGGIHHLVSRKIVTIGKMSKRFEEDPKRIIRYFVYLCEYGNPKNVPEEEKATVTRLAKELLPQIDSKTRIHEVKKLLRQHNVSMYKLMKVLSDFGVLQFVFPDHAVDTNIPTSLAEIEDRHMPVAWVLRYNDPEDIKNIGWDRPDANKISFLVKFLDINNQRDLEKLKNSILSFWNSGLTNKKLRDWAVKVAGMSPDLVDEFIYLAQRMGDELIHHSY